MLIIPKLSMPKNCNECPCNEEGHCSALWFYDKETHCIDERDGRSGRLKDCPLIEKKPGIRILRDT